MKKEVYKESGKFLLDIAKLLIGGVILSNIVKFGEIPVGKIIFASSIIVICLVIVALLFINQSDK